MKTAVYIFFVNLIESPIMEQSNLDLFVAKQLNIYDSNLIVVNKNSHFQGL